MWKFHNFCIWNKSVSSLSSWMDPDPQPAACFTVFFFTTDGCDAFWTGPPYVAQGPFCELYAAGYTTVSQPTVPGILYTTTTSYQLPRTPVVRENAPVEKSTQNNRARKSGKQWAAKNRFWQWPNDSQKNTSSPENCSAFLTPRGSKNVIRQVPDCSMLTMTLQHPRIIVCGARNLCNFVKDFYYNAPL